jgi:flagellin-specific chaperone FliS
VRRENWMEAMKKTPRTADAATPHQLIGMAYELAILACSREEVLRSQKAIGLLRDVMHSLGPADSSDLMGCYDWCLDRIGSGEFALAAQTLSILRQAWVDAEQHVRQ